METYEIIFVAVAIAFYCLAALWFGQRLTDFSDVHRPVSEIRYLEDEVQQVSDNKSKPIEHTPRGVRDH